MSRLQDFYRRARAQPLRPATHQEEVQTGPGDNSDVEQSRGRSLEGLSFEAADHPNVPVGFHSAQHTSDKYERIFVLTAKATNEDNQPRDLSERSSNPVECNAWRPEVLPILPIVSIEGGDTHSHHTRRGHTANRGSTTVLKSLDFAQRDCC